MGNLAGKKIGHARCEYWKAIFYLYVIYEEVEVGLEIGGL